MKVFELVALLQAMPQGLEVRIGYDYHDGSFIHADVAGVNLERSFDWDATDEVEVVLIHETTA